MYVFMTVYSPTFKSEPLLLHLQRTLRRLLNSTYTVIQHLNTEKHANLLKESKFNREIEELCENMSKLRGE